MPAKSIKVLLTVGGIGVAVHLLLLRCIAYWSYPAPADRSFVNNLLVNTGLSILGGAFYALFLRYPVMESIRERKTSPFVLFKGGVLGAVATSLALQGLYLGAACVLTYKMKVGVPGSSLSMAFMLALLSIETYGLMEVFYFAIPAFVCGVLVTAVVAHLPFLRSTPQP